MASFYENYYQIPYDFNQVHNLYDHDHQYQEQEIAYDPPVSSYNNYYYYSWNGSETSSASVASYSVSTVSEPNHLFYDPNLYTTYESPPQFSIYYSSVVASALDFNEPDFDEYDPTPYSGGYDIVSTYGKPLPPSEKTCYPFSKDAQAKPLPSPPEIIAPVPLGIYDGGEKKVVKKRVTFAEPLEEAKPLETIKNEEEEHDHHEEEEEEEGEDESSDEEDESEEEQESQELEEDHSRSSHGGIQSENVDKEEVKALYVPSGYGLEATDLCEMVFGGYFPCVLRNKRRQQEEEEKERVACWESNDSDPWKTTSDYLFGDSYPYGYENRSQFEISSYGYMRY